MIDAWVKRLRVLGCVLLVASVCLLGVASTAPLDLGADGGMVAGELMFRPTELDPVDMKLLLRRVGARQLVKPSQVQPAVMDRGVAAKLVKRIRLQGVIQIGGVYTAYVVIDQKDRDRVKRGDRLIEFDVLEIQPGKVVLSLDGVRVDLTP